MPGCRRTRVLINETLRRREDVASGGLPKITRKRTLGLPNLQAELGLLRLGGVVTHPAPRLIRPLSAQHDQLFGADDPLGVHPRPAAAVTNGQHLGHVLGPIAKGRDRLERPTQVIGVETRNYHLLSGPGPGAPRPPRGLGRRTGPRPLRSPLSHPRHVAAAHRRSDRDRVHLEARVRDDLVVGIPDVEARLEGLDRHPCDLIPGDTTNQLLALTGEHRPADDFHPTPITAPIHGGAA